MAQLNDILEQMKKEESLKKPKKKKTEFKEKRLQYYDGWGRGKEVKIKEEKQQKFK